MTSKAPNRPPTGDLVRKSVESSFPGIAIEIHALERDSGPAVSEYSRRVSEYEFPNPSGQFPNTTVEFPNTTVSVSEYNRVVSEY